MDELKPKRRWFQYRLLTALLVMVAASELLWLNLRPPAINILPAGAHANFGWNSVVHPEPPEMDYIVCVRGPGWPFSRHAIVAFRKKSPFGALYTNLTDDGIVEINSVVQPEDPSTAGLRAFRLRSNVETQFTIYNALIGLAILISIVVGLEFILRRREPRKP